MMRMISTEDAPQPAGHYSQATVSGNTVYVAGQLGVDPQNPGGPVPGAGAQTRQALANTGAVLAAAGSGLDRLLQVTIYVSDISLWGEINEAYAEVLGEHEPARAIVPVGNFKDGFVLEVQAIGEIA